MKKCTKCGVGLVVGDNWTAGKHKKQWNICKVCANSKQSSYVAENRDKARNASLSWKRKNASWISEYNKMYREDNLAKCQESARNWRRNNPEKALAHTAKRRAKLKSQTPDMNKAELVEIEAMYMYNQIMPGDWEVDHIVALANGGLHHPNNLQVLSRHDNRSKGARL